MALGVEMGVSYLDLFLGLVSAPGQCRVLILYYKCSAVEKTAESRFRRLGSAGSESDTFRGSFFLSEAQFPHL